MNRFCLCVLVAYLIVAGVRSNLLADEPEKVGDQPNILWIVGENLKLDLGCYGAKNVRTPNLDKLASGGVMYTRVFSTSPVCAPSRSAFL